MLETLFLIGRDEQQAGYPQPHPQPGEEEEEARRQRLGHRGVQAAQKDARCHEPEGNFADTLSFNKLPHFLPVFRIHVH